MLYRVYIDEAGDRGISRRASQHFVVSAVIVGDPDEAATRTSLAELRGSLKRSPGDVLHFRNLNHSQRIHAAQATAKLPLRAVSSVIFCKDALRDGMTTQLTRADPMYLYALRFLMERVSWIVEQGGGTAAIVTFGEVNGFQARKLHIYRERLEQTPGVNINWKLMEGHPFRIDRPAETEMLQVADIAASAIFRAVEEDEWGNTETRYLSELRSTIYRGRSGRGLPTSYGLKVFPDRMAHAGARLEFLRDM